MPSSLIFTGLVVLWLLILVPAVARHQQEVARPSGASLAGRVLARPRRRRIQARRIGRLPTEEGDSVDPERLDQDDTPTARETERPWVSTVRAAPARRGGGPTSRTDDRRREPSPSRRRRRRVRRPLGTAPAPLPARPRRLRPRGGRRDRPAPATPSASASCSPCWCARCSRGSRPRPRSPWSGGRTARSTSRWWSTWSTCAARSGWRRRSASAGPPAWPAPGAPWRPTTAISTSGPAAAARSRGVPSRAEADDADPESDGPTGPSRTSRGGRRHLGRRGRRHHARPGRRRARRPAARPAARRRRRDRRAGERPAPAAAGPAAADPAGNVAGRGGRRRARPARPRHPGQGTPPACGGRVRG